MLVVDRKKIIMWLILLIIVAGGVYYVFYFNHRQQVELPTVSDNNSIQQTPAKVNLLNGDKDITAQPAKPAAELSQAEKDRLSAKKLADFFVAMLGSYSTAANFKNIIDLQPLMSQRMREWSKDFIERNRDKKVQQVSITTKVVKSELVVDEGDRLVFLVKVVREESGVEEKKYNQTAKVELIKGEQGWLVDWLEWQ